MTAALEIISQRNGLPSICGRICSAPCETACILNDEESPIGIRALERYASDHGRPKPSRREVVARRGKRIAIVGSGPAGLSAARDLARWGYQVTVFEAFDRPGGVLRYGIPEYRIPEKVLDLEIEEMVFLGVTFENNCAIGHTRSIDELKAEGFSAILVATGAGIPKFMDIPGANLGGVFYGEEFLIRVNQRRETAASDMFPFGNKVVIIGSGNTALDCARVSVRLQRHTTLVCRKTLDEMRVRNSDRDFARDEGVAFEPLVQPVEIVPSEDGHVMGLKCVRLDYADENSTGTWSLIPVPHSEFVIEADTLVIAIGHQPNVSVGKLRRKLKTNEDGTLMVDPKTGMTSTRGIFAAGNVVTHAGPVVSAIASGQRSAEHVHQYLSK